MNAVRRLGALAACLALLAAACSDSESDGADDAGGDDSADAIETTDDLRFSPADITVSEGETVAFRPDYSFASLGDYLSPRPVLQLSASRGCYWRRCLFCPDQPCVRGCPVARTRSRGRQRRGRPDLLVVPAPSTGPSGRPAGKRRAHQPGKRLAALQHRDHGRERLPHRDRRRRLQARRAEHRGQGEPADRHRAQDRQ